VKALVVVHCYQGDADWVRESLPWHTALGHPVLVLSPADSPVEIDGVECRSAGAKDWNGPHTIERQYLHWKIAAEKDSDWFLLNDADSFCLLPEIPAQMLEDDWKLWCSVSGIQMDDGSFNETSHMRPPYFFHRRVLESLIETYPGPYGPGGGPVIYIDWMYVKRHHQLHFAVEPIPAGFVDGVKDMQDLKARLG
jgi:hypothetical protein